MVDLDFVAENVEQEYKEAKHRVGFIDRSDVGRIKVTGRDRADLLHRISTNDINGLLPGQGSVTCLTDEKARIVDLLTVYVFDDHLLLLCAPNHVDRVIQWMLHFRIREKFFLEDVTDGTVMMSPVGMKASTVLHGLTGQDVSILPLHYHCAVELNGMSTIFARTFPLGGDGFNVIVDAVFSDVLSNSFLELGALSKYGDRVFDILRVEAGLPVFGREITDEANPLDVGLHGSVSDTKGCYIGQEVIARLTAQEKTRLKLVGLALDGDILPPFHAALEYDGKGIGWLTSAIHSPEFGAIGLGYIKGDRALGEAVQVTWDGGDSSAETVSLPFAVS